MADVEKKIEDRQTGGQIDGQSVVETARDRQTGSRRTLKKNKRGMQTGGQTDGRSVGG